MRQEKIQRAWRMALFVLAAALLSACGGGGSSSEAPTETIGRVVNSTLKSDATGYTYPIQVFLPQS